MASDVEVSCVCDPNFAVICSFLERFAKPCGITHPNTSELQEMLENSLEVPQPLVDLHVKLLRKARKSVSTERWERALIKFCHTYSNQDGWEIERFGYKKARLAVKLRILKTLLELQFDFNSKFKSEINRLSGEELRCQPLGRDKLGQTYWCQQDEDCNLRIYREDLDDETWEVVAKDREGLVRLIAQLSSNDPFRKDPEGVLNDDSNSLGIEKPITDTGQAVEVSDGARGGEAETEHEKGKDHDSINGVGGLDNSSINDIKKGEELSVTKTGTSTEVKKLSSVIQLPLGLANIRQPSIVLKRCESTSFMLDSGVVSRSNSSWSETIKTETTVCVREVGKPVKEAEEPLKAIEEPVKEVEKSVDSVEKTDVIAKSEDRKEEIVVIKEANSVNGNNGTNSPKRVGSDIEKVMTVKSGKLENEVGADDPLPDKAADTEKNSSSNLVATDVKDTDATKSLVNIDKDISKKNELAKLAVDVNLGIDLSRSSSIIDTKKDVESHSKTDSSDVKLEEGNSSAGLDLSSKVACDTTLNKQLLKPLPVDAGDSKLAALKKGTPPISGNENEACDLSKKAVVEERSPCKIKIVVPEKYREPKPEPIQNSATDLSKKKLPVLEQHPYKPIGSGLPKVLPTPVMKFDTFSSLKLQKERLMKKRILELGIPVDTKRFRAEGLSFPSSNQRSLVKNFVGIESDEDFDDDEDDDEDDEEEEDEELDDLDESVDSEVGEAIEEPLMLVRGEGSGKDCDTGNPGQEENEAREECKEKESSNNGSKSSADSDRVHEVEGVLTTSKIVENGMETGVMSGGLSGNDEDKVCDKEELQGLVIPKISTDCLSESVKLAEKLNSENVSTVRMKSDHSPDGVQLSASKRSLQSEKSPFDSGESDNLSPVKSSPKLWSIETICAPDGKSRDQQRTAVDVNTRTVHCDTTSKVEDISSVGIKLIENFPTDTPKSINHISRWETNKPSSKGDSAPEFNYSSSSSLSNRKQSDLDLLLVQGQVSQLNSESRNGKNSSESLNSRSNENVLPFPGSSDRRKEEHEKLISGLSFATNKSVQDQESPLISSDLTQFENLKLKKFESTLEKIPSDSSNVDETCQGDSRSNKDRTKMSIGLEPLDENVEGGKKPGQGFFFGPGCLQHSMKSDIKPMPSLVNSSYAHVMDFEGGTSKLGDTTVPKIADICASKVLSSTPLCLDRNVSHVENISLNSASLTSSSIPDKDLLDLTKTSKSQKSEWVSKGMNSQDTKKLNSDNLDQSLCHSKKTDNSESSFKDLEKSVSCDRNKVKTKLPPGNDKGDVNSNSDVNVDSRISLDEGRNSNKVGADHSNPCTGTSGALLGKKLNTQTNIEGIKTPITPKIHGIEQIMTTRSGLKASGEPADVSNSQKMQQAVSLGMKSPPLNSVPVDYCKDSSVLLASNKPLFAPHLDKFPDKTNVFTHPGVSAGEGSSGSKTLSSPGHLKSKLDLMTKSSQLTSTAKNRRKSVESITMGIMMGKLAAKSSLQDSSISQIKSVDEVMGANRTRSTDSCNVSLKTDSVFTKPLEIAPVFTTPVKLNPSLSLKSVSEEPENLSSKHSGEAQGSHETSSNVNKLASSELPSVPIELLPSENKHNLENIINLSSKSAACSNEGKANTSSLQSSISVKNEGKKKSSSEQEELSVETKSNAEKNKEERNKLPSGIASMEKSESHISTEHILIGSAKKLESTPSLDRKNEDCPQPCKVDAVLNEGQEKTLGAKSSTFNDGKETAKELSDVKMSSVSGKCSSTESPAAPNDSREELLDKSVGSLKALLNPIHTENSELSKSSELLLDAKNIQKKDGSSSLVEVKPPGTISVVPFERLSAGKFPDMSAFEDKSNKEEKSKSCIDEVKINPPRGLKVVPFEKLSDKASVATILESSKERPVAPLIKVVPFEKLSDSKALPPKLTKEAKPSPGIKVVPFEKLSDKKLACSNNSQGQSSVLHENISDLKPMVSKIDSSLPPSSYMHSHKDSESVTLGRVPKQVAKKLKTPASEASVVSPNVLQNETRNTRAKNKNPVPTKVLEHNDKGAENIIADKSVLECLKTKDVEILPVTPVNKGPVRPSRGRLQVKAFAKEILAVDEGKSGQKAKKVASFSDSSSNDAKAKLIHMKDVEVLKSSAVSLEPLLDQEKPKDESKKVQSSPTVISTDKLKQPERVILNTPSTNNNSVGKTSKSKKILPASDKVNHPDEVIKTDVSAGNSANKANKGKKVSSGNGKSKIVEDIPKNNADGTIDELDKSKKPSLASDKAKLSDHLMKSDTGSDDTKANKNRRVSQDSDSKPVFRETRSMRSRSGGAPIAVEPLPLPRSSRKSKVGTPGKSQPEPEAKSPVRVTSPGHSTVKSKDTSSALNEEPVVSVLVKEQNDGISTKENSVSSQSKEPSAVSSEKEQVSKKDESRRKRNRVNTESELGSGDASGKRRKLRGKRAPDLKLRRNVEEQKQCDAGESSSDDDRRAHPRVVDGSSDESHSLPLAERTLVISKGNLTSKKRHKKGRGRQRGSRTGAVSPAPSSDATSEKSRPTEDKHSKKSKGRAKRAPNLLGLNVGVDIILDQSNKSDAGSNSSAPPVRQSRRIAQIKIREDAERRKLEEMTLFQLTEGQQHKKHSKHHVKESGSEKKKKKKRKKMADSDEDYAAAEDRVEDKRRPPDKKKKKKKVSVPLFNENNPWQSSSGSSSSQEEEDFDDLDHTEYEEEEEADLEFKSDHEFSPESDIEEELGDSCPTRRARTAQKDEDAEEPADKYACQKCGKSDHPEWILLCDKCDSGWHGSCLRPALLVIPEGDWFCPPCEHASLLESLGESLATFDRNAKRRDNEELRRKRLAYVGISLDNVLPNREKEDTYGGDSRPGKRVVQSSSSSSSSSESSSSSSCSGDESEPVYQLRQRRQALYSYRFNEYDDLINSAIQDEMEAVKGAGNQGRGKDIATIVNAEKEEQKEKSEGEGKEEPVIGDDADLGNRKSESEGEEKEKIEKEQEVEEEEKDFLPRIKKFTIKKKHRRLNSLDISSGDDADSDEDFKGSSSEEDEEEFDDGEGEDTDDSDVIGRRRRGGSRRSKNSGPVRRSGRARITRFDKEFINDDSDDSEPRKKSRRLWQESESEESDTTWGIRKRRKQITSHKQKSKRKKKKKYSYDSDFERSKKKKPKIKYGGLSDDNDDSPVRRTRGRKINYQEMAGSETEEEVLKSSRRKIESEDEYVAHEEDNDEEENEPKQSCSESAGDGPEESSVNKVVSNSEDDETVSHKKSEHIEKKLKKNVIRDDSEDEMKQIEEEMKSFARADELAAKLKLCDNEKVPSSLEEEKNNKSVSQVTEKEHSPSPAKPPISNNVTKEKVLETNTKTLKDEGVKNENSNKKSVVLEEEDGDDDEEEEDEEEEEEEEDEGEEEEDEEEEEGEEDDEEEEEEEEDDKKEVKDMGKITKGTTGKPVDCVIPTKEKEPIKIVQSPEKEVKEPERKPKGRIEVVPMEILCGKPMQKDMQPVQLLKNFPPLQHQKERVSQALKDLVVTQALKGLDSIGGPMINESDGIQLMGNVAGMQMGSLRGGLLKSGLDMQAPPPMTGTQALKNMMNMHALKGNIEPEMGKNLSLAQNAKMIDGDVGGMPLRIGQSGMVLDCMPPAGVATPTKRRGRGRGRATLAAQAAAAAAVAATATTTASGTIATSPLESGLGPKGSDMGQLGVGSRYPPPQHFQPHSSASVITRMLQSQPVSSGPQSFTAAAAAMGHKYFGSSGSEQSPLVGPPSAGRGTSSLPPYSVPPKGRIPSPYRQPPPLTESPNSNPGLGMGNFGNTASSRGSSVRTPLGALQQLPLRMRNPGSNNQPIYHTSHHPMDPSPSGGGPIVIASSPGRTGESSSPLHQQPTTSPSSSSPLANKSSSSHNTPPPPPYSRPPPLSMGQGPPSSNSNNPSLVPFPIQSSETPPQNGPPARHPPPPFPSNTSVNHLHSSPPPSHQGRSPVPGNYSPYHAPPSNYHYGSYPPPPITATDDALPPSAYQGSPYPDHYVSSDTTGNLQPSDGSNSKSYDEEGGGEFGGLVSYFSSQREDDLET